MRRFFPASLSLAIAGLLAALAVSGCTTTASTQVRDVSQIESAYSVAHAAAVAYSGTKGANPTVAKTLANVDSVAAASIAAYAASPSDNAKAQAAEIAMAALLSYTAQGTLAPAAH